ncbi:hypothetical protein M5689_018454 [Euphorbia peplus]|nr:hypothetical protein M5689_018454 [Euphorbia peplus]
MDTTPWGTPCVSEFSVNENRVTDSFDFGNGIGEANLTDTNGYFNGFEDSFQSQTSFSFTSLLQDFETDHAFAEYQEYLLNQQSNLMNHQSDMVQNRVVSCGEGDVAMGGLAPNSSMVNDHVLSPEEEKAMLEFTPTPEWEMMMEELAPYPSLVHDHGFSSHEATLEFVSPLNVVHDHVIPSTGGNMMMAEAALPPSVHGHVVSHEKENVVQNGRNLINILHPRRPRLTYCNGATSRIRWTTELHALFVSSVEELGGSDS